MFRTKFEQIIINSRFLKCHPKILKTHTSKSHAARMSPTLLLMKPASIAFVTVHSTPDKI